MLLKIIKERRKKLIKNNNNKKHKQTKDTRKNITKRGKWFYTPSQPCQLYLGNSNKKVIAAV